LTVSDFAAAPALASLLVALAVDALLGEPAWLYRRVPHPAVLFGTAITRLERRLLQPAASQWRQRLAGVVLLVAVAGGAAVVGGTLAMATRRLPAGLLFEGLLMSTLLAQRSLVEHVGAVAAGLRTNLAAGRAAVARIVGRDPDCLDSSAVGRAAVESLAENLSDGVVAPLFWGIVAGLPGMLAYKAVNTLDSVVGHRSERYLAFGWASARLDDLVNLVPARVTGALLCLAGGTPVRSAAVMLRDAPRHRSPNAGWPEAAMAAALGLRLAGPRVYDGRLVDDAWMGDGTAEVGPGDIDRALTLAWRVWWMLLGAVLAGAVASWR
jgi:adenosylcobinamide-phosphate synthase